jgi:hypothetical protein
MKRIFLSLAAGLLGLSLSGPAEARDRYEHPGHYQGAYYKSHARAFGGGYYYEGRDHHWAHRVWDVAHHRYHYWDPDLGCYFYWSAEHSCYYPTTSRP